MGKAKNAIKTAGEALITVIAWVMYIFAIRPIVLVIELIIIAAEFIFDLAVFPVKYMMKMKENEE